MDCKELIERGHSWRNNHHRQELNEPCCIIAEMSTAIEALSRQVDDLQILLDMYGGEKGIAATFQKAAERDAAVEDLRGMCWCCARGKPWEKAAPLSKLTGCEHLSGVGVLSRGGGRYKCPYWEWRGLKKGET